MAGTHEGGIKSSKGGTGNPNRSSPVAVENYLKGIDFPAGKEALLNQARNNNAPDDVIRTIRALPDKEYGSPIDVSKEVGHIRSKC
ncbi:MAG: DUF2795 domain-containing protein [Syntrophorhabdus sp.]